MLRSTSLWLLTLVLSGAQVSAQCPAVTTTINTYSLISTEISSQTRATASPGQVLTVSTCAEGYISAGAIGILRGGTATLSGASGASATATITAGAIPDATNAIITRAPDSPQSVIRIGPAASQISVYVAPPPSYSRFEVNILGGTSVTLDLDGGDPSTYAGGQASLSAIAGGLVRAHGSVAGAVSFTGTNPKTMSVYDAAFFRAAGESITATVAAAGTLELFGTAHYASVTDGRLTMYANRGTADIASGGTVFFRPGYSAGTGYVQSGGLATLSGDHTAYVQVGGSATAYQGGKVYVPSGGAVEDVIVAYTATAFMDIGAKALVGTSGTVSATAPGTTITSYGTSDDLALYTAFAAGPSNLVRRAMPRATCRPGMEDCPWSQGVQCVDTSSDIYNCGGCALDGTGMDCTSLGDGAVSCVKGLCITA